MYGHVGLAAQDRRGRRNMNRKIQLTEYTNKNLKNPSNCSTCKFEGDVRLHPKKGVDKPPYVLV